jgi:hypothetical protein
VLNITNPQEKPIRTTIRYHLTLVRILLERQKITSTGQGVGKQKLCTFASGNVNYYNHHGKHYGCTSKN